MTVIGTLHHLEIWVGDLPRAQRSLGWLLGELGYRVEARWDGGVSYARGATYLVLEAGPAVAGAHDRMRAGLNHLAFHAGDHDDVDALTARALANGWSLLFADRHPHAGGPDHYAAYLENADGFEVELVARTAPEPAG